MDQADECFLHAHFDFAQTAIGDASSSQDSLELRSALGDLINKDMQLVSIGLYFQHTFHLLTKLKRCGESRWRKLQEMAQQHRLDIRGGIVHDQLARIEQADTRTTFRLI